MEAWSRPHAGDLVDFHRLAQALDRQRSERLDLRVAFRQSGGVSGGPNGSRRGQLLDPRGQVCGLAHRRVVHAQITSDGPYDDLARVQAHPNLDEAAVGWPDTVRVPPHRLLHPQRGVARSDSVLFQGKRRTEERHDPVAHDLVDGALVAVYGFHHQLEHRIEQRARLFRVAVGQQLHRALHIGEEDGYLLTLALEGALRRQDPVDEVLGRVAVRRGEPKRRRRHVAGGLTTLVAEFDADGKLGATVRARRRQSRAALEAELRLRRVFVLAPRTLHARPPSSQAGETLKVR